MKREESYDHNLSYRAESFKKKIILLCEKALGLLIGVKVEGNCQREDYKLRA